MYGNFVLVYVFVYSFIVLPDVSNAYWKRFFVFAYIFEWKAAINVYGIYISRIQHTCADYKDDDDESGERQWTAQSLKTFYSDSQLK